MVGSLAMGVLAGYFAFRGEAPQHWRLFLMTGVLGGFTTFSAFSLDAAVLWERAGRVGCVLCHGVGCGVDRSFVHWAARGEIIWCIALTPIP